MTRSSALERLCERRLELVHARPRRPDPELGLLGVLREAMATSLVTSDPGAANASGAGAGAASETAAPVDPLDADLDSLESDLDAELRVIEAVERAKAILDAHALTALARMQSTADALVASRSAAASRVPVHPQELVDLEVATATGLGQREVGIRLELAMGAPRRFGRLRELLGVGRISLRRACEVVEQTRHLVDDETVDALVEAVFAPTRDGAGLSGGLFRQRLRRAILRADADAAAAAARRRAARTRNGAHAQVFDDGTGQLLVRNDADKIAAAMDRADSAARAARAAGDPRSLDQLRADFLTGAAIFGQPGPGEGCADPTCQRCAGAGDLGNRGPGEGPDGKPGRPGEPGAGPDEALGSRCSATPEWFRCFGQRPPGRVWIVVPITTALGLDEAPCQVPGYGWIAAEQARGTMTAEGSIWQTLLADVDTGTALRLSRKGYRPSATMVEHVRAVDGTCRGPGCTVLASRCDVDHDIPYPEGPTDTVNLSSKHRQHHRIRTAGFWRAVRDPSDASITWRTSAGRRYVTYPTDWLADVRPRPQLGGFDYNPEPIFRPYGPEPDPNRPPDDSPPPF